MKPSSCRLDVLADAVKLVVEPAKPARRIKQTSVSADECRRLISDHMIALCDLYLDLNRRGGALPSPAKIRNSLIRIAKRLDGVEHEPAFKLLFRLRDAVREVKELAGVEPNPNHKINGHKKIGRQVPSSTR